MNRHPSDRFDIHNVLKHKILKPNLVRRKYFSSHEILKYFKVGFIKKSEKKQLKTQNSKAINLEQ